MNEYLYEFDDPYLILAYHIIGDYRPADILRILVDNAYLKNCVLKEVRLLDIGGFYLDCIIEDILAKKDRMEYMHQLDQIGLYFYSKLDKDRLRNNIVKVLETANIKLPQGYSTGGNVSSHNT